MPFDEIVANPSDLKHVGELLGHSDGLGMVILTRAHVQSAFYGPFQSGSIRSGRTSNTDGRYFSVPSKRAVVQPYC